MCAGIDQLLIEREWECRGGEQETTKKCYCCPDESNRWRTHERIFFLEVVWRWRGPIEREGCYKCTGEGCYCFSGGRVSKEKKKISFLCEGLVHTFGLYWLRRKDLLIAVDVSLTAGGHISPPPSFLCYFCFLSWKAFYWSACEVAEARLGSIIEHILCCRYTWHFFHPHFCTWASSFLANILLIITTFYLLQPGVSLTRIGETYLWMTWIQKCFVELVLAHEVNLL